MVCGTACRALKRHKLVAGLQQSAAGPASIHFRRPLTVLSVAQPLETKDLVPSSSASKSPTVFERPPAEQDHFLPANVEAAGNASEEHHEQPLPRDVLREFEHKLEADLQSVAVTLTAVTGVIIFWRGVWSLLDYFMGDSLFGDICCIFVGLTIVLWIRLSGVKVAPTFWPPS